MTDAEPNSADSREWRERYRLFRDIGELLFAELADDDLLRGVTDRVIEASGADGGFLIRVPAADAAEGFEVVLARHYQGGDILKPEFEISRTLIRRAVSEGKPVFLENAALVQAGQRSRSLEKLKVLSVIALPLRQPGLRTPYAVIYLDRRRPGHFFSPVDLARLSEVMAWANRALELAFETRSLRRAVRPGGALDPALRASLVGGSPAMDAVADFISRAARSEATVLLRGETGTGKELVARLLHRFGAAPSAPFVAVNCAAIPAELIESELFGHEAGAFTGARTRRIGRFQEAGGGTLFLDEIGDMPAALQVKLLRVVETRAFSVLGGGELPFSARLVAATHQPLEKLVRDGRFRQDLYYRLAVLELTLPPLRERREDIPALAAHFIAHFARRQGRPAPSLSPAAERHLLRRAYPGNVRELAHLLERAIVFSDAALLDRDAFAAPGGRDDGRAEPGVMLTIAAYNQARNNLEREFVDGLLKAHHGNVTEAAKSAGFSRAYLYQLVKRHFPELLTPAKKSR